MLFHFSQHFPTISQFWTVQTETLTAPWRRRPFQVGDSVELRDLRADAKLNGAVGVVQGPGGPGKERPMDLLIEIIGIGNVKPGLINHGFLIRGVLLQ